MPANLPPQYFGAEKRLRLAVTPQEKISIIKEMLAIMPHHKGTDGLRAELNTKIAKLTKEMQKKKGTSTFTYHIKKEGIAQTLLIGLPNAGKSNLLTLLTNSYSEVAPYPFTTIAPVVGMISFENTQIQLIDPPAITHEFMKKWGSSLMFSADLLIFVIDLHNLIGIELIIDKINLYGNKKIIIIGNKIDLPNAEQNLKLLMAKLDSRIPIVIISCENKKGIEELKRTIYNSLNVIRVYTKEPGEEPELREPIALPKGSTVLDAAREVHKDFANNLKYARIWGTNRFNGQRVARNQELSEGDIIEFHI